MAARSDNVANIRAVGGQPELRLAFGADVSNSRTATQIALNTAIPARMMPTSRRDTDTDHIESQAPNESEVQSDHKVTMAAKVPMVLRVVTVRDLVVQVAVPSDRLRPCFIS
jgi:hypothetical protein